KLGIITSSRIRSGLKRRASPTANSASLIARTSYSPVVSRFSLISRVTPGSSSTAIILVLVIHLLQQHRDRERGSHARSAFPAIRNDNVSAVHFRNLTHDVQPKTGSVAGRLRGEERIKHAREVVFRNTGPAVIDVYGYVFVIQRTHPGSVPRVS